MNGLINHPESKNIFPLIFQEFSCLSWICPSVLFYSFSRLLSFALVGIVTLASLLQLLFSPVRICVQMRLIYQNHKYAEFTLFLASYLLSLRQMRWRAVEMERSREIKSETDSLRCLEEVVVREKTMPF